MGDWIDHRLPRGTIIEQETDRYLKLRSGLLGALVGCFTNGEKVGANDFGVVVKHTKSSALEQWEHIC
jgi:hypothetical protein